MADSNVKFNMDELNLFNALHRVKGEIDDSDYEQRVVQDYNEYINQQIKFNELPASCNAKNIQDLNNAFINLGNLITVKNSTISGINRMVDFSLLKFTLPSKIDLCSEKNLNSLPEINRQILALPAKHVAYNLQVKSNPWFVFFTNKKIRFEMDQRFKSCAQTYVKDPDAQAPIPQSYKDLFESMLYRNIDENIAKANIQHALYAVAVSYMDLKDCVLIDLDEMGETVFTYLFGLKKEITRQNEEQIHKHKASLFATIAIDIAVAISLICVMIFADLNTPSMFLNKTPEYLSILTDVGFIFAGLAVFGVLILLNVWLVSKLHDLNGARFLPIFSVPLIIIVFILVFVQSGEINEALVILKTPTIVGMSSFAIAAFTQDLLCLLTHADGSTNDIKTLDNKNFLGTPSTIMCLIGALLIMYLPYSSNSAVHAWVLSLLVCAGNGYNIYHVYRVGADGF